jgi:hypothetical protein
MTQSRKFLTFKSPFFFSFLSSADLSASLLLTLLVENATTSMQPDRDADTKTAASAMTLGRRSSRVVFSSSSNLKI